MHLLWWLVDTRDCEEYFGRAGCKCIFKVTVLWNVLISSSYRTTANGTANAAGRSLGVGWPSRKQRLTKETVPASALCCLQGSDDAPEPVEDDDDEDEAGDDEEDD